MYVRDKVYRQRSKRASSFFLEVYDALLLHIVHFFCCRGGVT